MKAFFRGDYVDKIIIGIDIGGTAVKIGILTREG
jgi:sugar (pentulose or hexulose) kinase